MFRLNGFFMWTSGAAAALATLVPIMARHGYARAGIGTRRR